MAILALYRRGVILAVASKNNPDDAMAAIQNHPDMILRPSTSRRWRSTGKTSRRA